jgi:hypothetical protein
MLNLFVAVIMDNFDYLTRDSSILGLLLVPPKDGKSLNKITLMLHIFKFSYGIKRINF